MVVIKAISNRSWELQQHSSKFAVKHVNYVFDWLSSNLKKYTQFHLAVKMKDETI